MPEEEWGQSDVDRAYIDEMVGTNLENGYYKLTVTVPPSVGRRTLITVGDRQLVADKPGEYAFLLEKGMKYPLSFCPHSDDIEVTAVDNIQTASLMSLTSASPQITVDDYYIGQWSRDGGDFRWMRPNLLMVGWVMWVPTLCVSPEVWSPMVGDSSENFTALLMADGRNFEVVTNFWYSNNRSLRINDPHSTTTEISWVGATPLASASASVDVDYFGVTLHSDLSFCCESDPGQGYVDLTSFRIIGLPNTMFVNNDDDDWSETLDCYEYRTWCDDDLAFGTVELNSTVPANGTIRIDNHHGFFGTMYDSERISSPMNYDQEWSICDEYGCSIDFGLNASSRSDGFNTSQLKVRWSPEKGPERTCVKRFTVVEPVVEPICNEIKNVVEGGTLHRLTYNPCGVAIGQNAYFKIEVMPNDYPDSMIVWSAEGDGLVQFVGGNTGREVCVRGLSEGETKLRISIGDCPSAKPTFTVQVVELSRVKLSFWIIEGASWTIERVNELVSTANDIYRQVGMEFYVDSIVTTNITRALNVVYDGPATENSMNFEEVANLRSGTGGIECYCIDSFTDEDGVRAATSPSGVLLSRNVVESTLAHEIGHVCGMNDVYVDGGLESVPYAQRLEYCHASDDWNFDDPISSSASSRYYQAGSLLRSVIKKELMYGESNAENDTRRDISSGYIYGVRRSDSLEDESYLLDVKTGLFKCSGTSRNPMSN